MDLENRRTFVIRKFFMQCVCNPFHATSPTLYLPTKLENQCFSHVFKGCRKKPVVWRHGVVVITAVQLYSTMPKLRFCVDSNPARGISKIRHGEDLWQLSRLELRLNTFPRRTIIQKQFIIVIIIKCVKTPILFYRVS